MKQSAHQVHASSPLGICMGKDLGPLQWIRAFQGKDVATWHSKHSNIALFLLILFLTIYEHIISQHNYPGQSVS